MDDVADLQTLFMSWETGFVRTGRPSAVFQGSRFYGVHPVRRVPKITKFVANLERRGLVFDQLPITIGGVYGGILPMDRLILGTLHSWWFPDP